jgi:hypothetical protein
MARRKSFKKRYNKNKQKNIAKKYSKKAIRRRSATKRQRLGGGLWFTRRA